MADDVWLVVGLGNPGPGYAGNRHNVGFMVADLLAGRMGAKFKSHKTRADVVEGRLAGGRVVLAKPRTYMNESGGPVSGLRDFFKVPLDRLVVVHDELDLPYGGLRLKLGGGDNGHNGLKSLRRSLGSGEFHRVRFGIGRPAGPDGCRRVRAARLRRRRAQGARARRRPHRRRRRGAGHPTASSAPRTPSTPDPSCCAARRC